MPESYVFPEGFTWGVATASFQIEGGAQPELRGPSVWDTFSAIPGRVLNNDTGMVACDHYNRYRDDVALMKTMGVKNYRLSLSWPRLMPEGTGKLNPVGVDFYHRLFDELLGAGITPHVTLFHWDSPQALEDRYGSWQNRQMAYDFADYVSEVVKLYGDKISNWMTVNEIMCFTKLGYGLARPGTHAPGTAVHRQKDIQQTVHHAILAHGLGVQAIRAASPGPCQVSLVDNPSTSVPFTHTDEDIAAAHTHFRQMNGDILVPILTGAYDELKVAELGSEMPDIQEGDMEIISQPLDGFGLNIYSGTYSKASDNGPYEVVPHAHAYPALHMPWLQVVPEAIYWSVRHTSEIADQPDLKFFISENGCAADDRVNDHGEVIDTDRVFYYRQYLKEAHRATAEGYNLQGYFAWSLMDNFEWAWGYDRRFGLTRVDYDTQNRTPKASFHWYAKVMEHNRVM